MVKKQIRAKIEKGNIIPLEPISTDINGNVIIIFLDENIWDATKKESLIDIAGCMSIDTPYKELTPELIDRTLYNREVNEK